MLFLLSWLSSFLGLLNVDYTTYSLPCVERDRAVRRPCRRPCGGNAASETAAKQVLVGLFPAAEVPPKFWGDFFRRRKSRQNFGEAFSDGGSPTKILGKLFPTEKVPPKTWRDLFSARKRRPIFKTTYFGGFKRYLAELVPALRDVFRPARRHSCSETPPT